MKSNNTSGNIWKAGLALLIVLVLIIKLSDYLLGDHKITEGMNLKQKDPAKYTVTYEPQQKLIYLSGTLEIGIVAELKNLLRTHPASAGLVLDSAGGNIYQARGIANLIIENKLSTYVANHCYSACTIAFLAGLHRSANTDAEIGFHGYNLELTNAYSQISIEQEQSKDLLYFAKQIPDQNFVEQIFKHDSNKLWTPTLASLLEAGVIHSIIAN